MLKKLPLIYLLQKGWQYAGRYRPLLLLSSFLFVLAQAVSLAEPYVIGRLLNCLQSDVSKNTGVQALKHDVLFYLGLFCHTSGCLAVPRTGETFGALHPVQDPACLQDSTL